MADTNPSELSTEAAKDVAARTIYTADGLWFLAVEEEYGYKAAFELNQRVWKRGGLIYARRLLKNLNLDGKPPLEALATMILADPIMNVRRTQVTALTDTRMTIRTFACPPAEARFRDGRGVFNGKPGCTLFLSAYAEVIDRRIKTTCVCCSPNPENPEYWCEWEFTLSEEKSSARD
ncbi:MAG: hypothetical protein HYX80_07180 [Chloroflexi bacterium]|nr:hypothetical protein [Chloroflexota bacterium]